MEFVTWSDNDAVDIENIDNQHRRMIRIINHLHSLLDTKDSSEVKISFDELYKHLKEHFHTEETYMLENKFPGYISHKLEHDRYYTKIMNYKEAIDSEETNINLEILNSLKKWFYNHLEINDRKLGQFLAEKGVK